MLLGEKINPAMIFFSDSRFSITILWVGSADGVNGPVIFLEKGTKVQPRLRGANLVTRYGLPEGSCVIKNQHTWMMRLG